jgi:hypothetical protein
MRVLEESGHSGRVSESGRGRTPAVLQMPAHPAELASSYDLTISQPTIDSPPFAVFHRWLAEAAADHGLSCALLHDGVVQEAIHRLARGELAIGFHLDYYSLWHRADDPYARLAVAVEDAGGRSVNLPARARTFTDKATMHAELMRRGLGTPATVVVRPWLPDRPLTAAEWERLHLDEPNTCVYLKAANGFGGRGIRRLERPDGDRLKAALAEVRQGEAADAFLIQREVRPPQWTCEDGVSRPAYWRVLHCLGEWLLFWWVPLERAGGRPSYRMVTPAELSRYRLQPVLDYAHDLADLTGLDWFSTELCLGDGPETSRHMVPAADGRYLPVLAIDYVNDQCSVDVQSRWPGALPNAVVQRLAERFAEAAWRQRQRRLRPDTLSYWRTAA